MAQMKEQIKILEKDLSKIEISNLSDAKFKTTGYKDAKGTWDFNSIKKIQSEKKDTLIELKHIQGNNNRADEDKR